mmetsp:Transcript_36926/g.61196  ORF Transcript_36926/g.61196 Transcript_36926/m.61196 type:complete len:210 (+) Transcript_36926:708-1337(+)
MRSLRAISCRRASLRSGCFSSWKVPKPMSTGPKSMIGSVCSRSQFPSCSINVTAAGAGALLGAMSNAAAPGVVTSDAATLTSTSDGPASARVVVSDTVVEPAMSPAVVVQHVTAATLRSPASATGIALDAGMSLPGAGTLFAFAGTSLMGASASLTGDGASIAGASAPFMGAGVPLSMAGALLTGAGASLTGTGVPVMDGCTLLAAADT